MPKKPEGGNEFTWGKAVYTLIMLVIAGFFLTIIISLFVDSDVELMSGNVAIIPIKGVILGDEGSNFLLDDAASSQDIVELIEKADANPNVKAIIFEINSPGGSAVASEEIADAIKKTNKTTVAWIREIGTSGAYWAASSADHIVASRVSITGSIGVIGSYLEFGGLLQDFNLTYRRLVSGKYKDIGDPFKELTQEEQDILQKDLDDIRNYFVEEVAKNRNMKKYEVEKAANGLFYLGEEAKKLGLVDELGGKDEAIRYIEQKESIKAEISKYDVEKSFFDLLAGASSEMSFYAGMGIGKAFLNGNLNNKISIHT